MSASKQFHPLQAVEVATAFNAAGVEYMFIGKSAAILLGFPGTTQDVDIFPEKTPENGKRIVGALRALGFNVTEALETDVIRGKDFVQITDGPFDLDLVFAPDGIETYAEARERRRMEGPFPVADIRDIIASKKAAGRPRDLRDMDLLEAFRQERERARWRVPGF